MSDLIYREETMLVLEEEEYHGYRYYIVTKGFFPLAYVGVKNKADLIKHLSSIEVHGGITFGPETGWWDDDKDNLYIGWDYAHFGDFVNHKGWTNRGCKKWTIEEIREEIFNCIKQLEEIKSQD